MAAEVDQAQGFGLYGKPNHETTRKTDEKTYITKSGVEEGGNQVTIEGRSE